MTSTPTSFASTVRDVIVDWLRRCEMLCERVTIPADFYQACYDDIERRLTNATGVPPTQATMDDMQKWISVGAAIGPAYQHLPTQQEVVFVCSYTTLLSCSDDIFQNDVEALTAFNMRFINNRPHEHPILNAVSALLREIPSLWEPIPANMAISSTLNFINALLLEDLMQDVKVG